MEEALKLVLAVVIAYLMGSVSFAVIFSRIAGKDVRKMGSGNAGSTNMLRNYGIKWALLTFICDFLKGSAAVGLFYVLFKESPHIEFMMQLAAIPVMLGHMKPVFFGFKGGKGVATALGALVVISPKLFGIIFILGLIIAGTSGFVSLAAVSMSALYPVAVIVRGLMNGNLNISYTVVSFVIGAMILYSHRANLKRLIKGEENSIYKKGGKARG